MTVPQGKVVALLSLSHGCRTRGLWAHQEASGLGHWRRVSGCSILQPHQLSPPPITARRKLRLPHHQIVPGKVGCRRGGVWVAFRSWLVHLHHPHFRVSALGFPLLFHHLRVLTSRPLWRTGSMFLRPEADDEKANLHLYTHTRKKGFNTDFRDFEDLPMSFSNTFSGSIVLWIVTSTVPFDPVRSIGA